MSSDVTSISLPFYKALQGLKPSVPFNGGYFTQQEIRQFQSLLREHRAHPRLYDIALSHAHLDPDVYVSRLALITPDKKVLQTVIKVTNMEPGLFDVPVHYYLADGAPQMQCFKGHKSFYRVIQVLDGQLKQSSFQRSFDLPRP